MANQCKYHVNTLVAPDINQRLWIN